MLGAALLALLVLVLSLLWLQQWIQRQLNCLVFLGDAELKIKIAGADVQEPGPAVHEEVVSSASGRAAPAEPQLTPRSYSGIGQPSGVANLDPGSPISGPSGSNSTWSNPDQLTPFAVQPSSSVAAEAKLHGDREGDNALPHLAVTASLMPQADHHESRPPDTSSRNSGSDDADERERALFQSISLGHSLAARASTGECEHPADRAITGLQPVGQERELSVELAAHARQAWGVASTPDDENVQAARAPRAPRDAHCASDSPCTLLPLAPNRMSRTRSETSPTSQHPDTDATGVGQQATDTSSPGNLSIASDLASNTMVGHSAIPRRRLLSSGRHNFAVIAAANRAVASAVAAATTQHLQAYSSRGWVQGSDGSTASMETTFDAELPGLHMARHASLDMSVLGDPALMAASFQGLAPHLCTSDGGIEVGGSRPDWSSPLLPRRSKSSPGTAYEATVHSLQLQAQQLTIADLLPHLDSSPVSRADGPLSMSGMVDVSRPSWGAASPSARGLYRSEGGDGSSPSFTFQGQGGSWYPSSNSLVQPHMQMRPDEEGLEASQRPSIPADLATGNNRPGVRSSTGWSWPSSGGSAAAQDPGAATNDGTFNPPPNTMDILAAAFGWHASADVPEAEQVSSGSNQQSNKQTVNDEVEEMLAQTWRSTPQNMRPYRVPGKTVSFNGSSRAEFPAVPAADTASCSLDGRPDVRTARSSMKATQTSGPSRHHAVGRSQTFTKKGVHFKDQPEELEGPRMKHSVKPLPHAQSQPVGRRFSRRLTGPEIIQVPGEGSGSAHTASSSTGRSDGSGRMPGHADSSSSGGVARSSSKDKPQTPSLQGLMQHVGHCQSDQLRPKHSLRKASAGFIASQVATPFAMHASVTSSSTKAEFRTDLDSLKASAAAIEAEGRVSLSGLTEASLLSSAQRIVVSDRGGSDSGAGGHGSDTASRTGRVDSRVKVMLVSSDASTLMTVVGVLPSSRYEIQYSSGADCIRLLCKDNAPLPDVLLLDCQLSSTPQRLNLRKSISRTQSDASLTDSPAGAPPSLEQVTALSLIETLRGRHDPSVLPIIALATPPAPGSRAQVTTKGSLVVLHNAVNQVELDRLEAAPHTMAAKEGVEALKRGANDYVVLPVLTVELQARINMQVALRRAMRLKAEAYSSMQLLRAILPGHVIRKLKQGQKYIAQYHRDVSIGFIDIVNFTRASANWPSSKVAQMLNDLFSRFDDICESHGILNVDTIGDGYMVLCGHDGETDHALKLVRAAVDMLNVTKEPLINGETVSVRIGINTGPAHSGVLGTKRFKYTVWGDTCVLRINLEWQFADARVNCASRAESSGFPNCIQVTATTYRSVMASMLAHRTGAAETVIPAVHPYDVDTDRSSFATSIASGLSGTQVLTEGSHVMNDGGSSRWGADSTRPSTTGSKATTTFSGERLLNTSPRASEGGEPFEFSFASLGLREIKGKGLMPTYLVKAGSWQEAQIQCAASQQQWQSPVHFTHQRVSAPSSRNLASKSSQQSSSTESHGAQLPGSKLRPVQGRPVQESEDGGSPLGHSIPLQPAQYALQQAMQARQDWRATSTWHVMQEDAQFMPDGPRVLGQNSSFNHHSYAWSDSLHLESLRPSAYRSSEYRDSYPDGRPPPPPVEMRHSNAHTSTCTGSLTPHRPQHPLASVNTSMSSAGRRGSQERNHAQQPSPGHEVFNVEAQLREVLSRHRPEDLDFAKRAALLEWISQQLFPRTAHSQQQRSPAGDGLPLHPDAVHMTNLAEQLQDAGPTAGVIGTQARDSCAQTAYDPFLKPQAVVFGNPAFDTRSQSNISENGLPVQGEGPGTSHTLDAPSSGGQSPAIPSPRTSTARSSSNLKSSKSIKKVGHMFKALVGPKSKSGPQNSMLKALSKVAAQVEAMTSPRASREGTSRDSCRASTSSAASRSKHPRIGISKTRSPSLSKEGWLQHITLRVPAASTSGVPALDALRTGSLCVVSPKTSGAQPMPSAHSESNMPRNRSYHALAGFGQVGGAADLTSPKSSDSNQPLTVQYRLTAHGTLEPKVSGQVLATERSVASSASRSTPRLSGHTSHGDVVQTKLSAHQAGGMPKEAGLRTANDRLFSGYPLANDSPRSEGAHSFVLGTKRPDASFSSSRIPSNSPPVLEQPAKLSFTNIAETGELRDLVARQTLPGTSQHLGPDQSQVCASTSLGASSTTSRAPERMHSAPSPSLTSTSSRMHRPKVVKRIMQWFKEQT